MLHVRLNLITADPIRLGDSVKFVENEVRPVVEGQPGNLGMALKLNPDIGVAILESFWVSGDALRASERMTVPNRAAAVRRASGTVTVERYSVPVFEREAPLRSGEGVRVTRLDVQPGAVEDTVAAFGDVTVPWLADTEGFCSTLLFIDRTSGRSVVETVWRDSEALAASRSAAAAIRVDTVRATNGVIRSVEEYQLVFSSARKC
ncbi:MAG TPA: antibiotic biosynthesis monooxygenase [Streptosporangiaceae bacterium]|jgi:heme-degrading monooxygenase HmoA